MVAERVGKYTDRWFGSGCEVMGDASADEGSGDVLGVLRKARARSHSSVVELSEEVEEEPESERISGAVYARTFVVEINSSGAEI
jgi:hypothetical protein